MDGWMDGCKYERMSDRMSDGCPAACRRWKLRQEGFNSGAFVRCGVSRVYSTVAEREAASGLSREMPMTRTK